MTEITPVERWERAQADMVVCYVLTRVDTPGKPSLGRMAAQTHHCGTQMTEDKIAKAFPDLDELYDEWQRDPALEIAAALADETAHSLEARQKVSPQRFAESQVEAEKAREVANGAKRTFGTVLTLAVTAAEMRQAVSLGQLLGLHAGITHDPTYPIFLDDGGKTVVVTAAIDSCAYVFGRKSACAPVLNQFDLLSEKHIVR